MVWRADFVNELSDEAIDLHIQYGSQLPSQHSTMHLYPINGAVGRVGKQDTAFSYRDATWAEVMVGVDPNPANAGVLKDWTIAYWEALHPHSAGGAYVNMMMDEGTDRLKAAYRDNYDRLVPVKNRYDPRNLFHFNQNIKPTECARTLHTKECRPHAPPHPWLRTLRLDRPVHHRRQACGELVLTQKEGHPNADVRGTRHMDGSGRQSR